MAIDMTPIVGRIVVLRVPTSAVFPWFVEGGRIVKVTAKTITYLDRGVERKAMGFAAICDTAQEEKSLLDFSAAAQAEYAALKQRLLQERMRIHPVAYGSGTDVNGAPATPTPAPAKKRRVRGAQSAPEGGARRRRTRAG